MFSCYLFKENCVITLNFFLFAKEKIFINFPFSKGNDDLLFEKNYFILATVREYL